MSIDQLERRLPEILSELSLPRVPDYTDDLLGRTARMPQRPAWTYPERWFPVSTLTNVLVPLRRPALRPLLILAVLAALIVASFAWYIGSQRPLPPLFGPARNGLVVTTNSVGDVVTLDPASNTTRTLFAGPKVCCATVSPDGQRVAVVRVPTPTAEPNGLVILNIDGTVVRELPADLVRGSVWFEWSPPGDRFLLAFPSGGKIVDVATGAVTAFATPPGTQRASWIGTTGDILLTAQVADTTPNGSTQAVYRLPAGATSGATQLTTMQYVVDGPQVSPDGSRFMYFIWGPEDRLHGRIHVFTFATGADVAVTPETVQSPADMNLWENPVWSPDGSRIAAEMYTTGPNQVAIIPATGGDPVIVGPEFPTGSGGAAIRFSPDGNSLLVKYRVNATTWLLPVSGGEGRQLSWDTANEIDWQRLAP
jgi:hypothetical protein